MVMQNRYYNSPSSLIASAQQTQAPNTRLHSGYRRTDASTNSTGKHNSSINKQIKDLSSIHNLKADQFIKARKELATYSKSTTKHRKSDNVRKWKHKPADHVKGASKSQHISGNGTHVASLKGSQHLFSY